MMGMKIECFIPDLLNVEFFCVLEQLRILEVSQSKIVSEFTRGSSLEKVSASDMIVA